MHVAKSSALTHNLLHPYYTCRSIGALIWHIHLRYDSIAPLMKFSHAALIFRATDAYLEQRGSRYLNQPHYISRYRVASVGCGEVGMVVNPHLSERITRGRPSTVPVLPRWPLYVPVRMQSCLCLKRPRPKKTVMCGDRMSVSVCLSRTAAFITLRLARSLSFNMDRAESVPYAPRSSRWEPMRTDHKRRCRTSAVDGDDHVAGEYGVDEKKGTEAVYRDPRPGGAGTSSEPVGSDVYMLMNGFWIAQSIAGETQKNGNKANQASGDQNPRRGKTPSSKSPWRHEEWAERVRLVGQR
ncbi:uncharacterized protein LY79DRAFT_244906 [Colletotrichum navitas]|uniref:Uncharacterized protein n=1 Tax=Colletotrichum navitas TaxID=681940 RepID=A0AAD8PXK3_9PEZI|nr:uncharacterized protein LY79DRAFT_244906 [Colletotrichum navitas]KAK1586033.1 hypothetical protein LY79DRAFT_244906 [Colletotrichum navitas]